MSDLPDEVLATYREAGLDPRLGVEIEYRQRPDGRWAVVVDLDDWVLTASLAVRQPPWPAPHFAAALLAQAVDAIPEDPARVVREALSTVPEDPARVDGEDLGLLAAIARGADTHAADLRHRWREMRSEVERLVQLDAQLQHARDALAGYLRAALAARSLGEVAGAIPDPSHNKEDTP
jgi:hypothetical protein